MGKQTQLGVQGMVWGDRSNVQIVRLPVGPAQSAFRDIVQQNNLGIGDALASLRAADSLITNVSLELFLTLCLKRGICNNCILSMQKSVGFVKTFTNFLFWFCSQF